VTAPLLLAIEERVNDLLAPFISPWVNPLDKVDVDLGEEDFLD
jgi:hypothetical protein